MRDRSIPSKSFSKYTFVLYFALDRKNCLLSLDCEMRAEKERERERERKSWPLCSTNFLPCGEWSSSRFSLSVHATCPRGHPQISYTHDHCERGTSLVPRNTISPRRTRGKVFVASRIRSRFGSSVARPILWIGEKTNGIMPPMHFRFIADDSPIFIVCRCQTIPMNFFLILPKCKRENTQNIQSVVLSVTIIV